MLAQLHSLSNELMFARVMMERISFDVSDGHLSVQI